MKRKNLSSKKSNKMFSRGSKVKGKNNVTTPARGGYRL